MKRNGTTSNGTTRWRCKICGASLTKQRSDITNAALFRAFIQHLTAGTSLAAIAGNMSCSTRTLQRKFDAFWLVDVPDPTIGHTGRVYDQIITAANKLGVDAIVMASHTPELSDYLLGPNSARVVRHAKQSVFVVRGE